MQSTEDERQKSGISVRDHSDTRTTHHVRAIVAIVVDVFVEDGDVLECPHPLPSVIVNIS